MDLTIKKLFSLTGSPLCLDPNMAYPTEYETNFLNEYDTNKEQYDRYFIKEHGEKIVDVDGDIDADIILNWKLEIQAIQRVYLNSWARIWDTLNMHITPSIMSRSISQRNTANMRPSANTGSMRPTANTDSTRPTSNTGSMRQLRNLVILPILSERIPTRRRLTPFHTRTQRKKKPEKHRTLSEHKQIQV